MRWFDVDRGGLAKLLERRGREYVVLELVSNALDTGARNVRVKIEPLAGRPLAIVEVEDDDPDGFRRLDHAWTLFAESARKGDPTKRGRFNLGEKLVLALCSEASIETTTGTVWFDEDGRHRGRATRTQGSLFRGWVRMTREEIGRAVDLVRSILLWEEDGVSLVVKYHEALCRLGVALARLAVAEPKLLKMRV